MEKALGFYQQALAIGREIGDRRWEGNSLGSLGLVYADLGEMEKAIRLWEQQLIIAREIDDRRGEGGALVNLGVAYANLGEGRRAFALLEQALEMGRTIKDPKIMRIATDALAQLRGDGGGEGT